MPRKKATPRAKPRRRQKIEDRTEAVEELIDDMEKGREGARPRGRPKSNRKRKAMTAYVPPELHMRAKMRALEEGRELSELVTEALEKLLGK